MNTKIIKNKINNSSSSGRDEFKKKGLEMYFDLF